jgi:hypothetical protein
LPGNAFQCFILDRSDERNEGIKLIGAESNVHEVLDSRRELEPVLLEETVRRSIELNLADASDWLADPLFWVGIGVPGIVVATAALYFLWVDYKSKRP